PLCRARRTKVLLQRHHLQPCIIHGTEQLQTFIRTLIVNGDHLKIGESLGEDALHASLQERGLIEYRDHHTHAWRSIRNMVRCAFSHGRWAQMYGRPSPPSCPFLGSRPYRECSVPGFNRTDVSIFALPGTSSNSRRSVAHPTSRSSVHRPRPGAFFSSPVA